jgi:hypothetical protein
MERVFLDTIATRARKRMISYIALGLSWGAVAYFNVVSQAPSLKQYMSLHAAYTSLQRTHTAQAVTVSPGWFVSLYRMCAVMFGGVALYVIHDLIMKTMAQQFSGTVLSPLLGHFETQVSVPVQSCWLIQEQVAAASCTYVLVTPEVAVFLQEVRCLEAEGARFEAFCKEHDYLRMQVSADALVVAVERVVASIACIYTTQSDNEQIHDAYDTVVYTAIEHLVRSYTVWQESVQAQALEAHTGHECSDGYALLTVRMMQQMRLVLSGLLICPYYRIQPWPLSVATWDHLQTSTLTMLNANCSPL